MSRNLACKLAGAMLCNYHYLPRNVEAITAIVSRTSNACRARECDVAIKNAQCVAFVCVSTAASFVSHYEQFLYQPHFQIATVANLDLEVRYSGRDRMPSFSLLFSSKKLIFNRPALARQKL